MEIVEVENKKEKSKIQNIFTIRLKELIQNIRPHRIESEESKNKKHSLVAVTSIAVIATLIFSISVIKIGIMNAALIVVFIISIIILALKYYENNIDQSS